MLRRLQEDSSGAGLADRQAFYDIASGRGWSARYDVNPSCRLGHSPWDITVLPPGSVAVPLADVLALAAHAGNDLFVSAPGMAFVRRLHCLGCRSTRNVGWRLSGRLDSALKCRACGGRLLAAAINTEPELAASSVGSRLLREPPSRCGFVVGDVFALRDGMAVRHFQFD